MRGSVNTKTYFVEGGFLFFASVPTLMWQVQCSGPQAVSGRWVTCCQHDAKVWQKCVEVVFPVPLFLPRRFQLQRHWGEGVTLQPLSPCIPSPNPLHIKASSTASATPTAFFLWTRNFPPAAVGQPTTAVGQNRSPPFCSFRQVAPNGRG